MIHRTTVAIATGDHFGVNPDALVKALSLREIYEKSMPVVVGEYGTLCDAIALVGSVQSIRRLSQGDSPLGQHGIIDLIEPSESSRAENSPETPVLLAAALAASGQAGAVVCGNADPLHTRSPQDRDYLTIHAQGKIRIAYPSRPLPLKQELTRVTRERVSVFLRYASEAARFIGINDARIAVLGLNPSPDSHPGQEETDTIMPVVEMAKYCGVPVFGPFGFETAFNGLLQGHYDMILAMYHDQGLIPMNLFKASVVNWPFCGMSPGGARLTWGMQFPLVTTVQNPLNISTVPERADTESLIDAIRLATGSTPPTPFSSSQRFLEWGFTS